MRVAVVGETDKIPIPDRSAPVWQSDNPSRVCLEQ